MAHTPGPWTVCGYGRCTCKLVSGEHHPIAQIISGEWGDEYPNVRLVPRKDGIGELAEPFVDRIVYGEVEEEIAQANARLIAAAPKLLKACKGFISYLDTFGGTFYPYEMNAEIDAIRSAVAEAEGEK